MIESNRFTWLDPETSIPSVLGLSPGAIKVTSDIVTPLQKQMLIWFLALWMEVIDLSRKLSQLEKANDCKIT